jgi:hypothetical protein
MSSKITDCPMSKLFPHPDRKSMLHNHKQVSELTNQITLAAIANHRGNALMQEIYLAGVWHGAEIMRNALDIKLADPRLAAFTIGGAI